MHISIFKACAIVLWFGLLTLACSSMPGIATAQSTTGTLTGGDQGSKSSTASSPSVWRVGPGRTISAPGQAARRAGDGDVIEIDAGLYHNDHAVWTQDDITIRGVGGPAHLRSSGLIPNGKAIWIIKGHNVLIEHVEFSGAAVVHTNGAGIRHEGGDLTLRHTFFHDNEFSVLSGRLPEATITVESSRFWHQKRPTRHSHGIYIGAAHRLNLVGSHFKGTDLGHQVKSRALHNYILYNRIEDVDGGNSSRLIDLPNCGLSVVMGNDLHQGIDTENSNAIGYGPEGCEGRDGYYRQLFVVNNTFINEATGGQFVRNFTTGDVLVANNLVVGRAVMLKGGGVARDNFRTDLQWQPARRWRLPRTHLAIDAAVPLRGPRDLSLLPTREFALPAGTRPRATDGSIDLGSREWTSDSASE